MKTQLQQISAILIILILPFFYFGFQPGAEPDESTLIDYTILPQKDYSTVEESSLQNTNSSAVIEKVLISGRVVSSTGAAVEGAVITALVNFSLDEGTIVHRTKSFEDGTYQLTLSNFHSTENSIQLIVSKEGYREQYYKNEATFDAAHTLIIPTGVLLYEFKEIDFQLNEIADSPAPLIYGNVNDNLNFPIAEAFVLAYNVYNSSVRLAFTDINGEFVLEDLNPELYNVLFAADGFIPEYFDDQIFWEFADSIALGDSTSFSVSANLDNFSPGAGEGSIRGNALRQDGSGIAGVLVVVQDGSGNRIACDVTDGRGNFSIGGLTSGRYKLLGSKRNYSSQMQDVAIYTGNNMAAQTNLVFPEVVSGIGENNSLPEGYELSQNYPNPFNPSTTIRFSIPEKTFVRLSVFSVLGSKIAELVNDELNAGSYNYVLDASGYASGVYYYRLETRQFTTSRKMLLLQ